MLEDFPEVRRKNLLKEEAREGKWSVSMVVEEFPGRGKSFTKIQK